MNPCQSCLKMASSWPQDHNYILQNFQWEGYRPHKVLRKLLYLYWFSCIHNVHQRFGQNHKVDCSIKSNVLRCRCLFQLINGAIQLANVLLLTLDYEPLRLRHKDTLFKIVNQKSSLDIHFSYFIIIKSGYGQENSYRL